ncbi:MAG TPA: S53 family peptidase [Streptosporangiaceae bacterium]|jgi:subtilase family serine protease|nr:S53 family peptidase [Streptosporangiaceae bacterium]
MSKSGALAGVIASAVAMAGISVAGLSTPAHAGQKPAYTPIAGSSVPFTSHTRVIGTVAGSTKLTIQVWLTPNVTAAQRFATAVSTPGSTQFHHYLSPAAYTADYGPTASAAAKVESWLHTQGFTGISAGPGRSYVRATATATAIDAAFRTKLNIYQSSAQVNGGAYALRANSQPVSVPGSLSGSVLGVTGLDNAAPILPIERPGGGAASGAVARKAQRAAASSAGTSPSCSHYYGQYIATGWPQKFGTTSFPTEMCGYSGGQLRAAYGANAANTGQGQTIALVELGLTQNMFLTLQDYAAANKLPAPSLKRYAERSLGRGSACGDPFNGEEQLDVEASYAMAPGANQLVVGGDSCNNGDAGLQGLFDAELAVLNGGGKHPLASVASNSWESGSEGQGAALTNIEHAYLLRAAAEGVGMYFSSGDGSGVLAPSSDPYAIAVGGTTLGLGKTSNRLFETGWSTDFSLLSSDGKSWQNVGEYGASGGGPSLLWSQPGYQKGVVPAALAKAPGNRGGAIRSVPDISADADPFTGMAVGQLVILAPGNPPTYLQIASGGTSLAVPLVAGMVTAAQQGRARPFGFINPAIYKLAGTGAFHDALPITASTPALYHEMFCSSNDCGGSPLLAASDIQSYSMPGYTGQVTLKGYDNMSGLGTPSGQAFITALRKLEK